jgi:hypothetical protein
MTTLRFAGAMCALIAGASAHAQYVTGFERPAFTGSSTGVAAAGQSGWYTPAVAGTLGKEIYSYAGNALGLPANPTGGAQFIGGRSAGGTAFPRAQYNTTFGAGLWSISYDIAVGFNGTLPSADNLGSFSLNDQTQVQGTYKQFIALNRWMDNNNTALGWRAEYNVVNAAGAALNNQSPGAAWNNLLTDRWYRQTTVFSFTTNEIVSVSLTDLSTNTTNTVNPAGWYLTGGAASALPLPGAVRFFTGGNAGNITGWDNLTIIPTPGALALLGLSGLAAARRRR